jgi:hypothetical protein
LTCKAAYAQSIPKGPSSFCKDETNKSAKFNDNTGFSNVVIRQGGYVKVYREVASPDLDWAIYDSYVFSSVTGDRAFFSRAVIYAGNPIVYVMTKDASGKVVDNTMALPDGFYVPSEPLLQNLEGFCKLEMKQK